MQFGSGLVIFQVFISIFFLPKFSCNWEVMMEFQLTNFNKEFSPTQSATLGWDIGCHRNFGRYFLNSFPRLIEEGAVPGFPVFFLARGDLSPWLRKKPAWISFIQWFIHKTYIFRAFVACFCLQKLRTKKKQIESKSLCVRWNLNHKVSISTGVILLPTRTTHHYKGNHSQKPMHLHGLIPPTKP